MRARQMASCGRWHAVMMLGGVVAVVAGCADHSYDSVQLGQRSREYERRFPEQQTRQTDKTLCWLQESWTERADAVVLLLTDTRQVCGKWQATFQPDKAGLTGGARYHLRGTLAPGSAGYHGTGPLDTLRAIADDLTDLDADEFTRNAHGWVAAGIVRLVQQWPQVDRAGPAEARLRDMLARVPAGGQATIIIQPDGRITMTYTYGAD